MSKPKKYKYNIWFNERGKSLEGKMCYTVPADTVGEARYLFYAENGNKYVILKTEKVK